MDLNDLYTSGFALYEGGKFREASDCFKILTVQEPKGKRNWMGLASSHYMLNEYELALQAFACSAILDPADPYPHLYAAECFWELGKEAQAKEALRSCEQVTSDPKILNKIELLRDTWSNSNE